MSTNNRFGPKKTAPSRKDVKDIFVGPDTKKLTVELDAKLHQQLKLASVNEGRPMRALLEEALEAYFNQ